MINSENRLTLIVINQRVLINYKYYYTCISNNIKIEDIEFKMILVITNSHNVFDINLNHTYLLT